MSDQSPRTVAVGFSRAFRPRWEAAMADIHAGRRDRRTACEAVKANLRSIRRDPR